MWKILCVFSFIFLLLSCGDSKNIEENTVEDAALELTENIVKSSEITENEKNLKFLLREKELSLTTSEKLREIAIKAKGDYKRLSCLLKCSPSVIKRLLKEDSFATQMAIDRINEAYDLIITKDSGLDYINTCKEVKWTNKIFGKPDYLKKEDNHAFTLNETWETVNAPNQESFEEAEFSVNKLKSFELEMNEEFQKQLIENSHAYFEDVLEDFFDKEYGIQGSLRELKDQVGKSEDQRLVLWQARIKHYFSTIGYMSWVRTEIDSFSSRVNKQRKMILENQYNFTYNEELKIKNQYLKPFEVNDVMVLKAKKESENNLNHLIVDGIAISLTIVPKTRAIGKVLDTLLFIEFIADESLKIILPTKDDTKILLTYAYKDFINNIELSYSNEYNSNTEVYYNQLLNIIENRRDEKVRL